MNRIRGWLEAGLPWGILGLMGAGVLGGEIGEGIQRLVQQNGAVLLLAAILVQYAPRAIEAQKAQAAAMADLAAAVRESPRREDMRFEEVLVGQQLILNKCEDLDRRLEDVACRACPGPR